MGKTARVVGALWVLLLPAVALAQVDNSITNATDGSFSTWNLVYRADGTTPMPTNRVLHIIKDGAGDGIDPPSMSPGSYGQPTGDDVLIREESFGGNTSEAGKFIALLIVGGSTPDANAGDKVYVRVFDIVNTATSPEPMTAETQYTQMSSTVTLSSSETLFHVTLPKAEQSLPVELSSFTAAAGDGLVILSWRTESELNNAGFNVYRGVRSDGEYQKLTSTLIPGAGTSPLPHDYSYEDRRVENGKTYYYKLEDVSIDGVSRFHGPVSATPQRGEVAEPPIPKEFALGHNYPNPFNPGTDIRYQLPKPAHVTLTVYNLLGHEIRTLVDEQKPAGYFTAHWDGKDNHGQEVPSGVYIYRIHAGSFVDIKKMLLLR